MSSPCNNDIPLPHAGLLTYFRQPNRANNREKDAQIPRVEFVSSRDCKHGRFDEEAQNDFWDSGSTCSTDTDCEDVCQPLGHQNRGIFYALYDLWCFWYFVAIDACAVMLVLNLALGQFGIGGDMADCILGRHLPTPPIAHEVCFSLL